MSERILGRGAELEEVGALLGDDTAAVRALVLTGDAGVGKTTIWEEGVRLARERGLCVLAARCALSCSVMRATVDSYKLPRMTP